MRSWQRDQQPEYTLNPLPTCPTNQDQLKLAYCLGFFGPLVLGDLTTINTIRNRFAHKMERLTFGVAEIRNAIDGNFCRCGSYPNIIKATLDAADKLANKEGS